MILLMDSPRCPDCAAPITAPTAVCAVCRLPLHGPVAMELWRLDTMITQITGTLADLRARRTAALDTLRTMRASAVPVQALAAPPGYAPPPPPPAYVRQEQPPRLDLSRFAVRNLLLALGATLLGLAAVVFTIVSWGSLTLPVRGAILLGLTAVALAAPWPLVRRGLGATAEAVAAVGLVLIVLQSYAAYSYGLLGRPDPHWYAATAAAVVAAGWACYARWSPVRLPAPTSVLLAQVPLPLVAVAASPTTTGVALALIVTGALDLTLVWRSVQARVALPAAAVTGLIGTAVALLTCTVTGSPRAAVVLVVAAAVAMAWAWLRTPLVAAVAALSVAGAIAGPLRVAVPSTWAPAVFAGTGFAVFLGAYTLPSRLRAATSLTGAGVLGLTALSAGPEAVVALVGPVEWAAQPWHGAHLSSALRAVSPVVPLIFVLVGAVLAAVKEVRRLAPVAVTVALLTVPAATGLPYPASVVLLLAVTSALLGVAVWREDLLVVAAGYAAVQAVLWSLADRHATVAVLTILVVLLTGSAFYARTPVTRGVTSAGAVLAAGGLAGAIWALGGWPGRYAPYSLLAVCAVALAAARRARTEQRITVEAAAAVVALAAPALAIGERQPVTLALSLGLVAVLAACSTLLRPAAYGAAALTPVPLGGAFLIALFGPYGWMGRAWGGAPASAREALSPFWHWPAQPMLVPALMLAALAVTLVDRRLAPAVWTVAAVPVPLALDLPYWAALALLACLGVALAAWAVIRDDRAAFAALGVAALVTAWSLTAPRFTLLVLAGLVATAAGCAAAARDREGGLRNGAALIAALALGGFAASAGIAAGLPVSQAAFGVLAAAGVAAAVAAATRWSVIEAAGYLMAAAGIAMTLPHAGPFSLALAVTGVLAFGVSLRRDRRDAIWPGAVLLQFAAWIRLDLAGVHTPEAYTIPLTAVALVFGLLRHRRSPAISSWPAFGPALAVTLLPSLVASWDDPGWVRALLLGVAALAVTLAGARYRLQAPALLGGAVLVLDACNQLSPAAAQLVSLVPRWAPIALAGLALLLIGATYERRLRDLRRLRDALGRLR